MKHGIISGCYDESDGAFRGYYWHDLNWYAGEWVPMEEVE